MGYASGLWPSSRQSYGDGEERKFALHRFRYYVLYIKVCHEPISVQYIKQNNIGQSNLSRPIKRHNAVCYILELH